MKPVVVLTTTAIDFDFAALAHALVDLRLAACVNILPRVQSVYRWEGSVLEDEEILIVIKTTDDRVETLREEILRRHTYAVPEFIVLPITDISDSYASWLLESVS